MDGKILKVWGRWRYWWTNEA